MYVYSGRGGEYIVSIYNPEYGVSRFQIEVKKVVIFKEPYHTLPRKKNLNAALYIHTYYTYLTLIDEKNVNDMKT